MGKKSDNKKKIDLMANLFLNNFQVDKSGRLL